MKYCVVDLHGCRVIPGTFTNEASADSARLAFLSAQRDHPHVLQYGDRVALRDLPKHIHVRAACRYCGTANDVKDRICFMCRHTVSRDLSGWHVQLPQEPRPYRPPVTAVGTKVSVVGVDDKDKAKTIKSGVVIEETTKALRVYNAQLDISPATAEWFSRQSTKQWCLPSK
jgi:hypothetical protein